MVREVVNWRSIRKAAGTGAPKACIRPSLPMCCPVSIILAKTQLAPSSADVGDIWPKLGHNLARVDRGPADVCQFRPTQVVRPSVAAQQPLSGAYWGLVAELEVSPVRISSMSSRRRCRAMSANFGRIRAISGDFGRTRRNFGQLWTTSNSFGHICLGSVACRIVAGAAARCESAIPGPPTISCTRLPGISGRLQPSSLRGTTILQTSG